MSSETSETGETDNYRALLQTVHALIAVDGCPWHLEQTHKTLTPYLLEECYELLETLEADSINAEAVTEELADLLYQILLHAALAERDGEGYTINTVVETLNGKLRGRHPHVFADTPKMTAEELRQNWQHLKERAAGEKHGSRSLLHGIPAGLPALARAAKIVTRLKHAGIPVREMRVMSHPGAASTGEIAADVLTDTVVGERLLSLVCEAVDAGIDPDSALRSVLRGLEGAHV